MEFGWEKAESWLVQWSSVGAEGFGWGWDMGRRGGRVVVLKRDVFWVDVCSMKDREVWFWFRFAGLVWIWILGSRGFG